MSVKGKQRQEQTEFKRELFVGFASVRVVAINPTREELNKLLGKEDNDNDKPLEYLSQDQEGNDRLRLTFWLHDEQRDKYFVHSFNLTNRERTNKDKDKVQIINSTCSTTWVPYVAGTTEADKSFVPAWFKSFTDKEKNEIGKKKWRKALSGEEELANLMRAWLGRLNWMDVDTEVQVDTEKLFKENYKELRGLIDGDYDTPFVALLGVRTDENDSTKKYQQVYGKSFLPNSFMKNISKGMSFTNDYQKKVWKRFEEEVNGEYGFDSYFELGTLTEYDETKDIAGAPTARVVPEPTSSEY